MFISEHPDPNRENEQIERQLYALSEVLEQSVEISKQMQYTHLWKIIIHSNQLVPSRMIKDGQKMVDLRESESVAKTFDHCPPGQWIVAVYNQNRTDDVLLHMLPKPAGVTIRIVNLLPIASQLYPEDEHYSRSLGYLCEDVLETIL